MLEVRRLSANEVPRTRTANDVPVAAVVVRAFFPRAPRRPVNHGLDVFSRVAGCVASALYIWGGIVHHAGMHRSSRAHQRVFTRASKPIGDAPFFRVDVPRADHGTVTLITGCMFSGKTSELLRRIEQHTPARTLAVKHAIDTRYSTNEIVSHAGKAHPARSVTGAAEILVRLPRGVEFVAIDEAHHFDMGLVDVTSILAHRGLNVVLTSLDPNSWGKPFAVAECLKKIADEPITLTATCARCKKVADYTQRLTPIIDGNMVDGPENYEARCRNCWSAPPEPEPR